MGDQKRKSRPATAEYVIDVYGFEPFSSRTGPDCYWRPVTPIVQMCFDAKDGTLWLADISSDDGWRQVPLLYRRPATEADIDNFVAAFTRAACLPEG